MPNVRIKTQFTYLDFDDKEFIKTVKDYMKEQHIEAIKRWVRNVAKKTPTYTGTARGTIAPVGRAVGVVIRKGLIRGNPKRARQKKYFKHGGRSWPLGFGAGANYQEHKIYGRRRKNKYTLVFMYHLKLPYAIWNNLYPSPLPLKRETPWGAVDSGNTAYLRYMNGKVKKNFPKPQIRRKRK
jgi:hypothetical protein